MYEQGREEEMFRNLAKKYSLDPTIFGLSPTPVALLSASQAGIATTSLSFGQPTPLGSGSSFGMVSPASSSYGSSFGGFGQTFGSAGQSTAGNASFGGLASAPVQSGFGAMTSPSQSAFGMTTPFGGQSPFGAPRR
jgi:hypothetical protein